VSYYSICYMLALNVFFSPEHDDTYYSDVILLYFRRFDIFFVFDDALAVDDMWLYVSEELLNWFFAQGYQYFRPINGHDGSTLSVPSSTYVSH